MHVTVTSNHDARRHVAKDACHEYQAVDDAERYCRHCTPVPLSQVCPQVLGYVDVRRNAVIVFIGRRPEQTGRRSKVRHIF